MNQTNVVIILIVRSKDLVSCCLRILVVPFFKILVHVFVVVLHCRLSDRRFKISFPLDV